MFLEWLHTFCVGIGFDLTQYWQYALVIIGILIFIKK